MCVCVCERERESEREERVCVYVCVCVCVGGCVCVYTGAVYTFTVLLNSISWHDHSLLGSSVCVCACVCECEILFRQLFDSIYDLSLYVYFTVLQCVCKTVRTII